MLTSARVTVIWRHHYLIHSLAKLPVCLMKNPLAKQYVPLLIGLYLLAACTPVSEPLPTLAILPTEAASISISVKPLPAWEIFSSSLSAGQIEHWQFTATAGDAIRVRVVPVGSVTLSLMNANGDVLSTGDEVALTVPADDTYTIEVQPTRSELTNYDIGLAYTDRPNPNLPTALPEVVGVPTPTPADNDLGSYQGELLPQAPINAELNGETPHIYTLRATEGDIMSIVLNAPGDPILRLFDPAAQLVAMDDNSGTGNAAHIRNVQFAQGGVYSVQVSLREAGPYELALIPGEQALIADSIVTPTRRVPTPYLTPTVGPVPAGERLQDHLPALGELESASDFSRYSFYALAGEVVTIGLAPAEDSSLRPSLEVFGPDGSLVANATARTSDAVGKALVRNLVIPEEGAYLLIVTGEDGSFGGYSIGYGYGQSYREHYAGQPEPDTLLNDEIATHGTRNAYQLTLRAGDAISVAVNPVTNTLLDPVVEIADSDGHVLYQDDNGGSNRAALLRFAQINADGTYWLRVYDATSAQIGGYTLRWRIVESQATPTAVPMASTIMSIRDSVPQGEYGFYSFYGRTGQQVQIRVTATNAATFDPVAVLLDPNGQEIAEGDDSDSSMNPLFFATLPADGTYTVRVNGYLSGGDFELNVSLILP